MWYQRLVFSSRWWALTCVISKRIIYLCDVEDQYLPVWYERESFTCMVLKSSTYLCDIKVQYFLHVGGQTGEHAVESPVVGEVSHRHRPHRWWRRNLTPGSRDTLKRGGSVCLKVRSHNHSRFRQSGTVYWFIACSDNQVQCTVLWSVHIIRYSVLVYSRFR